MATRCRTRLTVLVATLAGVAVMAPQAKAQDGGERIVPTNNAVLTGYGTVGYGYRTQGENQNEFTASFSPIFLFQFQDRFLFEVELEFELQEGVTETGLEYASLDYIASDNLVLVAGKFLLPFGVFSERYHPTWINEFPSSPPIYGHHVAEFGVEPLLPILSDVGVLGRATARPGQLELGLNLYATNGPAGEEGDEEIPELELPASSSDNNKNKMLGGRLDFGLLPWAEVNLSYLNGNYDDENVLDFTAWNIAAQARWSNFGFRGEYIQTRQEIETFDGFPTLRRHGFYSQFTYRWGPWQPVFRWTQIFDDKLNGQVLEDGALQAGFGLDYWFAPSIALMAGYELNREQGPEIDNDRLLIHVAFGF